MKKRPLTTFITVSLRIFLGVLFITAGIGKLVPGFPGLMGPPWLEARLEAYDLALFARFIAYSQLLIGWLLLSRRFATLGAVMLLPMLLNILMVTISQNWTGTPYVVSVFLLMNCWLLAADYHKLKFLITDHEAPLRPIPIARQDPNSDKLVLLALLFLLAGAAMGKTDLQLAYVFIGSGLTCGLVLPLLFRKFKKADLKTQNLPEENARL